MNAGFDETSPASDRHWRAMQYVLGELPESQLADFETAMVDDVALCEAVSGAVLLCSGVLSAIESERKGMLSPAVAHGPSRGSRFAVTSACATLALTLLVMFFTRPAVSRIDAVSTDGSVADVLASMVSDELPPELCTNSEEDLMSVDSLADLVAPEWLITAIELDDALHESDVFSGESQDDDTDVF